MAREVDASDYTDEQLTRFFKSLSRLIWSAQGEVPDWVAAEAEAFSTHPPTPDLDELRQHITHAVVTARGWDDPDDHRIMLHSAIKSYYLVAWIEHLERARRPDLDLTLAYSVSFTPDLFTDADP